MRPLAAVLLVTVVLPGWAGRDASSAAGGAQTVGTPGPKDRATYFANADLQSIWSDLESRQVINKRVVEGGTHSINVRIVKEGDAPLVHAASADVWIVTAGTSIAVTGGELIEPRKRANSDDEAGAAIRNGVEQSLQPGDVLYVPAGVPHGFRNVRGFRALLVRFDSK